MNDNPTPEPNLVLLQEASELADRLTDILAAVTVAVDKDNPELTGNISIALGHRLRNLREKAIEKNTCDHTNCEIEIDYIWQANQHQTLKYDIRDLGQRMYKVLDRGEEATGSTESFEQWTVTCGRCGRVLMDQQGPDRTSFHDMPQEWQDMLEVLVESFGEDRGEHLD